MSMSYGIVRSSFWTGSTGRALRQDGDAQVVALYLMTSPHANIIGVFRCPIEYIKLETGRTIEGASKGLMKLCEIGFCTVDPTTETIWVHEMARYQIGDALKGGDKRVKHVARFFDEIENPLIKRAFFEKYGTAFQLVEPAPIEGNTSPFDGASMPLGSPIEATVTVTNTFTVTDTVTPHPSDVGQIEKSNSGPKNKRAPSKTGLPVLAGLAVLQNYFVRHARETGIANADSEFERFIDHHRMKGNVFADWEAAARTWLRNSVKFGSKPGNGGSQRPNGGFTQLLVNQAERMNGTRTIEHNDHEFERGGTEG